MANTKIKDLTEKDTGAATDEFLLNDVAGGNVDKKMGMDGIRITASQTTDFNAAVQTNKIDDLTVADDNTDLDATTLKHGLMPKADKSKLDGIESSATADQSNAEIKTAYEANADTNEFSDAEQTKLTGIETSAKDDQTDAEIKIAYENNADTNEYDDAEQTKLAGIETSANNYSHPNHTGDVTSTGDGATVIGAKKVTTGMIADGAAFQRIRTDSAGTEVEYFTEEAGISFVIDGGGSAITTGVKGDLEIPFACTINRSTLFADQTGSIVIDIFKDIFANFPPVVGDSIAASAKPTISSSNKDEDDTLTGWTTQINAGDVLRFNVDSVTTIERVTVTLSVNKEG